MYILMIARGYPTKQDPQRGCFERDQAEALRALGHKVVMVSVDARFILRWRKIGMTYFRKNEVDVYNSFWLPMNFVNCFNLKLGLKLKEMQLKRLYGRIEKEHGKPDVVFGHFFYNMALGVCLQTKCNIPLIGIEHSARFNQNTLNRYTLFYGKYAFVNVNEIITVSDSLRKRIKFHFNKESKVVHNMVGEEFLIQNLTRRKEVKFPSKYVTVGSLVRRKGFDVLINAFAKSGLKEKGVAITIVGGGEERIALQQQITDAGLTDNIFLVGTKSKLEIIEILKNSDVFVLPSRSENFSVAVLEALSLGLPVIASICGGIKECIDNNNGLLVPVDDINALSDTMQKMYHTYTNYDRKTIVEDCRNRFSPSVIAEQLTIIFEEVIENSKKKE